MATAWAGAPLYPECLLAVLILVIIVVDALFWPRRPSGNLGYLTLCGLLLVLSTALEEWTYGTGGTAFHDLVFLDTYATFFDILVLAAALCAGRRRAERRRVASGLALLLAQLLERALQPGGGERLAGVEAAHL